MKTRFKRKFQQLKNHPNSWVRISAGVLLIVGGIFGALPILGFWMLPLGLILLSVDFPWAKRIYLNIVVIWRKMRDRYRKLSGSAKRSAPDPSLKSDSDRNKS